VAKTVFFAQDEKQCGPAALAMTLAHAGVNVTPEDLVDEVYLPARDGSLTSAVLAAARRHGRIAYPIVTLSDVLAEIDRGYPVLVLQNLGLSWVPKWHYAVAIGYDLSDRTIMLHSGTTPFLRMPIKTFERTWERASHWGLLTLRPGDLPARARESVYVSAVAGVERAGQNVAAADSYRAALARWPQNPVALMGLGNALYAAGDLTAAAAAFELATARLPESADAFNNLAHVLAELGRLIDGEQAAQRTSALGGQNMETYRETLRSIQARRAAEAGLP